MVSSGDSSHPDEPESGPAPPPPVSGSGTQPPDEFERTPSTQTGPCGTRKRGEVYRAVRSGPFRAAPSVSQSASMSRAIVQDGWPVPWDQFAFDPQTMATGTALDDEQKQVVLYYHYNLRRVSYYDLLHIEVRATRREVKKAYFRLSKAFHPDRWYRKDTGEFGELIEDVFKWLNRAYSVLSSPRKRKGYNALIKRGFIGEWQLEGQGARRPPRATKRAPREGLVERGGGRAPSVNAAATEQRRTVDLLLARARKAESSGEWDTAVDLYQRALQVLSSADLRIRVVECMLKANMDPHEIDQQLVLARTDGVEEKVVLLFEAEVGRRVGDKERAVAAFRSVLELEPSNPVARLGIEWLEEDGDDGTSESG